MPREPISFVPVGIQRIKERLTQCRKIITDQTKLFSKFRGKLSPILSCMLSLKEGGKKTLKEKTPKRLKISRENSFAF